MHPVRQLNRTRQRWLINPKNRIKERVNPDRVGPIFITEHSLEFVGNWDNLKPQRPRGVRDHNRRVWRKRIV